MEATILSGQMLDHYQVLEQLGAGGMATVYKAYDTRQGGVVAVKVILAQIADTPSYLRRFELEAHVLAQLNHPNIVGIMDYGKDLGLPYLVMPYIPGGTLKQRIVRGPIPYSQAAATLAPVAWGLEYAHQHNVIHRDVKPSNILFTANEQPMLTDFGVAKLVNPEQTLDLTEAGLAFGSVEYMSPEQALNRKIDYRVDIYSLGIVLFEMITGVKPFRGDSPPVVLRMQAYDPPPDPRHLIQGIPDRFAQVILQALAKNPDNRFSTMGVLAELLNYFSGLQGPTGGRAVGFSLPGFAWSASQTAAVFADENEITVPEENRQGMPEDTLPTNPIGGGAWFDPSSEFVTEPFVPPQETGEPVAVEPPRHTAGRMPIATILGLVLLCATVFVGISRYASLQRDKSLPSVSIPPILQENPTSGQDEPRQTAIPGVLPSRQAQNAIPPITGDQGWQQGRLVILVRKGARNVLQVFSLQPLRDPEVLYDPGGTFLLVGPSWSPDGKQIAFYAAGSGTQVIETAGSDPPHRMGDCNTPTWSPDGRRILCKANHEPSFQVYDAQGGRLIQAFEAGGIVPAWSPDGQTILFSSFSNGESQIWTVPYLAPSSSQDIPTPPRAVHLASQQQENYAPSWSPDGQHIAFQAGAKDGISQIWVMDRDGGNRHQVTRSAQDSWSRAPTWSPDGRWLAYVSDQSGSFGPDYGEVYVVSLDTGNSYQLTNTGGRVYDWRVSWGK